jgi:hypothetical protein
MQVIEKAVSEAAAARGRSLMLDPQDRDSDRDSK